MSIQNAFNSLLGSAQSAAALYAFSPAVQEARQKKIGVEAAQRKQKFESEVGAKTVQSAEEIEKEMERLENEVVTIGETKELSPETRKELIKERDAKIQKLRMQNIENQKIMNEAMTGKGQAAMMEYELTGDPKTLEKAHDLGTEGMAEVRYYGKQSQDKYSQYRQAFKNYKDEIKRQISQKNGLQERKEILKNKPNKKKGGKR